MRCNRRCRWSPCRWAARGSGPTVTVGQEAGARLVVEHLLELGHTTVHHLSGPAYSMESRRRVEGWQDALAGGRRAARGAVARRLVAGVGPPRSAGEMARRITAGEPLTAVFAGNDQMALGLMVALREQGLSVPGDVSVVGFDDVPEAPYFSPALTTVRQDFAELGRRGVQLVLARLAGEPTVHRPGRPLPAGARLDGPCPAAEPAGPRCVPNHCC